MTITAGKRRALPVERQHVWRISELADVLGLSRGTIRKWLAQGVIPKPVEIDGNRRWRRHEIEDWLAAGCPPAQHWIWEPSHRYTVEQLIKQRHRELKTLDDEYRANLAALAEQEERLAKGRRAVGQIGAGRP
jgi:excisionase family DNA binding protein